MKTHFWMLAVLLLAPGLRTAGAQDVPSGPEGAVLFRHVQVVAMDVERAPRDEDVLVLGGTIKAVGPGLAPPPGAKVVDGQGTLFLAPGLADMHVHSDTAGDMAVFLAKGVTTILNMGHAREGFVAKLRPAINRGERPGPHIYLSFLVDGSPEYGNFFVETPDEARALVHLAKTNGYDFLKVYNNLSPECFNALLQEGRAQGLPVIGHGVTRVGLERQLEAGQLLVAHLEEYLYTVFTSASDTAAPSLDQIPRAVAFTKRCGAYVTADLNTYATIARQWGRPEVLRRMLASPQVRFLDPDDRLDWQQSRYFKRPGHLEARLAFLAAFLRALDQARVPLLAGTDAPGIPGLVPGFSLHEDLRALRQAGLSPFAVLSTATRIPGEFMQKAKPGSQPFGTIAAGARADLVLVRGNPLEDLSVLENPLGVMAGGHWYTAGSLHKLLPKAGHGAL